MAAGQQLTATCSRGLEQTLAEELRALGATKVEAGAGVVCFRGDLATIYRANLCLRTAMRVLLPLAQGPVSTRDELYQLVAGVAWEDLIRRRQTVAVEAVGRTGALRSTVFAAQVVKDAVVDRVRRRHGSRPDVDRTDPDLRLHLHLGEPDATLSLDSSGAPLSHRGYRRHAGPAPLAETLAAGMLLLAGYDGSQELLDPMCGSGTIAAEAALIAGRLPPGHNRPFACHRWHWHDPRLWQRVHNEVIAGQRPTPAAITAADNDRRAINATRHNLAAAGVASMVTVVQRDLALTPALAPASLLVSNPPYGRRLGEVEQLQPLYRLLGDTLKQRAAGSTAWLLVGARSLANEIHLKTTRRVVLFNGPIECRLLCYQLYQGTDQTR